MHSQTTATRKTVAGTIFVAFTLTLFTASISGQYRGKTPRPGLGSRPPGHAPRPTQAETGRRPTARTVSQRAGSVLKQARQSPTTGLRRATRPAVKNLRPQKDWTQEARLRQLQRETERRERARQSRRKKHHVEAAATASPTLDTLEIDPARKAAARRTARKFFGREYKGREVHDGIRRVSKLRWDSELKAAAKRARALGRPILWIQALGDIGGYT